MSDDAFSMGRFTNHKRQAVQVPAEACLARLPQRLYKAGVSALGLRTTSQTCYWRPALHQHYTVSISQAAKHISLCWFYAVVEGFDFESQCPQSTNANINTLYNDHRRVAKPFTWRPGRKTNKALCQQDLKHKEANQCFKKKVAAEVEIPFYKAPLFHKRNKTFGSSKLLPSLKTL